MKACAEGPLVLVPLVIVTFGAKPLRSARLTALCWSSSAAFSAVMATGVVSRLCWRNCAVTTISSRREEVLGGGGAGAAASSANAAVLATLRANPMVSAPLLWAKRRGARRE